MSMKQVNLMHILVVGPLLTYIGYKKDKTEEKYFNALGGISSLIPFIVKIPKGFDYKSIIRILHYFTYFPLYLYISYKGKKLNKKIFLILFIYGIIIIIINLYLLFKNLNIIKKQKKKIKDKK